MPTKAHGLLADILNFFPHESPWAIFVLNLLSKFKNSPKAVLERISDRSSVTVRRSALKKFLRDSSQDAANNQERLTLTSLLCEGILPVKIRTDQFFYHYETRMLCCATLAHKQCFWHVVREGWCRFCGIALRADGLFNNLGMPMERMA